MHCELRSDGTPGQLGLAVAMAETEELSVEICSAAKHAALREHSACGGEGWIYVRDMMRTMLLDSSS